MAESSHASGALLHILHVTWWSHIKGCFDFRGIRAYAIATDDVAEQYTGGDPKDAFFGIELPYLLGALKVRSRLSIRVLASLVFTIMSLT